MQLTSKDANMIVDFYPVKYADGDISTRYILKTVTFMGQSQSKRYILKRDFDREVTSRVEGYGYTVTEIHTEPQLFNSGLACCCWSKRERESNTNSSLPIKITYLEIVSKV